MDVSKTTKCPKCGKIHFKVLESYHKTVCTQTKRTKKWKSNVIEIYNTKYN